MLYGCLGVHRKTCRVYVCTFSKLLKCEKCMREKLSWVCLIHTTPLVSEFSMNYYESDSVVLLKIDLKYPQTLCNLQNYYLLAKKNFVSNPFSLIYIEI